MTTSEFNRLSVILTIFVKGDDRMDQEDFFTAFEGIAALLLDGAGNDEARLKYLIETYPHLYKPV